MNRSAKEFECGTLGFYFVYLCSRHFRLCGPLQETYV